MFISESTISTFISHYKSYLPQALTLNSDFDHSIKEKINSWQELMSIDVCLKRKEKLNLSLDASDLRERVLWQEGDKLVIAGARFRNLDVSFPFVRLNANFSVSIDQLQNLQALVESSFSTLKPKGFTVEQAPGSLSECEIWSHVVFGRTDVITSPLPTSLKLVWSQEFSHFSSLVEGYEKHLEFNPWLKGLLRWEDEDSLKDAASQRLLLQALSEQEGLIGLIAGQEQSIYGVPALYIFELFVSPDYQGNGIGSVLQQNLITKNRDRFGYVWGHINHRNKSSLKTAQNCGRKNIETEYFFEFGSSLI